MVGGGPGGAEIDHAQFGVVVAESFFRPRQLIEHVISTADIQEAGRPEKAGFPPGEWCPMPWPMSIMPLRTALRMAELWLSRRR